MASGHEARKAHKVIQNQEELYLKPIRNPTEQEKRNMLVKCIEIMIMSSLENHVYKFGDQIRKQSKGGPIGLALTGEIAECYMINWDKEFLERLKSVDMNPAIYERFKDDITVVVESLEAGTRWKDGALIVDLEKKNDDEGRTDEEITMEVFKDIAESIDDMISFTVDYPGNHKNGMMPVLDVQAAINKNEDNKIEFEFYEKPTKNQRVILFESAIPSSQKRTILTQECLRRIRNTQTDLGLEVKKTTFEQIYVRYEELRLFGKI